MRRLMAVLAVTVLAAGSIGQVAMAQDDACEAALIAAPIETMEVPDGWRLINATVVPAGWYGTVIRTGGSNYGDISFQVMCAPSGRAAAARNHELRTTMFGAEAVDLGTFGDYTHSVKYDPFSMFSEGTEGASFGDQDGFLRIETTWGRGDVLVQGGSQARDMDALAAVMQALDDVLSGTPA